MSIVFPAWPPQAMLHDETKGMIARSLPSSSSPRSQLISILFNIEKLKNGLKLKCIIYEEDGSGNYRYLPNPVSIGITSPSQGIPINTPAFAGITSP